MSIDEINLATPSAFWNAASFLRNQLKSILLKNFDYFFSRPLKNKFSVSLRGEKRRSNPVKSNLNHMDCFPFDKLRVAMTSRRLFQRPVGGQSGKFRGHLEGNLHLFGFVFQFDGSRFQIQDDRFLDIFQSLSLGCTTAGTTGQLGTPRGIAFCDLIILNDRAKFDHGLNMPDNRPKFNGNIMRGERQ